MTFSISKKDLVYGAVIAILVVGMSASFLAYKASAQESKNPALTSESAKSESEENSSQDQLGIEIFDANIPHLSCAKEVDYSGMPTSNTYDGNDNYMTQFMADGQQFQDLNGDSLPDYAFVDHNYTLSGTVLAGYFTSCVYLNNGSGWDRAYICYALTRSDQGTIIESEYRGDCAGTPSGNDKE